MGDSNYADSQNPPSAYAGKSTQPPAPAPPPYTAARGRPPAPQARNFAVASAKTMIDRFRGLTYAGKWPSLDRKAVADRLDTLIDNPDKVDQGGNGLCGEAAFFNVWLWEDPFAVVRFSVQLYNGGAAAVGTEEWVRPRQSLKSQDFNGVVKQMLKNHPNAADLSADWMMMSALRDANNWVISYDGTPSDEWGAGSSNGEVADWLRATNLFKGVSVADGRGTRHDLATAMKLKSQNNVVILSIDSHMLGNPDHGSPTDNHNAVLKSPIAAKNDGTIDFGIWSWGEAARPISAYRADAKLPLLTQTQFTAEFFGAIVASR